MKPGAARPDAPVAEHSRHSGGHHQDKGSNGHDPAGKAHHGDCAGHVGLVSSCCMSAALPKAFPALPSFDLHDAIFSNYLFTLLPGFDSPPFHPPILS
ncbi:MAG: hypothetical protein HZA01_12780 [Nitrospinae bacterium]|nr:hypothetical protein [Nitrospinota bacterium]